MDSVHGAIFLDICRLTSSKHSVLHGASHKPTAASGLPAQPTCEPLGSFGLLGSVCLGAVLYLYLLLVRGVGPSRAKSASRSLRRALLMPQVNTGSLYRCGKRT